MKTEFGQQFLIDAYTGQGGFKDGEYLIRHPRETDEKFAIRKQLAVYPNYVKKVVDSYISHLFKQAPVRDVDSQAYMDFATGMGGMKPIGDTIEKAFLLSMISGTVFLVVDKPRESAVTRAEEIEKGLLPYVTIRTRQQLNSIVAGIQGNIEEISFIERQPDDEIVYRFFDRNSWKITSDPKGNRTLESGDHGLGVVPVVPLNSTKPISPSGIVSIAWCWDITALNWDIFNAWSEKKELFRNQTFSVFTMPFKNEEDIAKYSGMTMSTENALPYNPEHGGKPEFIAPPPDPVELYSSDISAMVKMIYELANLEFTGGVQGSGVALSYHFQEANRTIATFATQCERAEREIARLVCLWQETEYEGNIAYPRDFSVADLLEELQIVADSLTLDISDTFAKEIKKKFVSRILSEANERLLQKINDEIDGEGDPYKNRIDDELGRDQE